MSSFRAYYQLAKPGIVRGNLLVAVAAYLYGAKGDIEPYTFFGMIIGIILVIGSACVYNNMLDRDIDQIMNRTKKRALVTDEISMQNAGLYGTTLLIIGLIILLMFTNLLTVGFALLGHVAYVVLYGYAKRTTVHGTLIGTISGSTPPVIGYVAATGKLDLTALLLFIVLVAWQMPHFFAIAIFRLDDYKAAKIPVLPAVKGIATTRRQIIFYAVLVTLACIALGVFSGAGLFATLVMTLASAYWLYLCTLPAGSGEATTQWARRQFRASLIVLAIISVALSIDGFFVA